MNSPSLTQLASWRNTLTQRGSLYQSGRVASTPTLGRGEDQEDQNQQDMETGRGKDECLTSDRLESRLKICPVLCMWELGFVLYMVFPISCGSVVVLPNCCHSSSVIEAVDRWPTAWFPGWISNLGQKTKICMSPVAIDFIDWFCLNWFRSLTKGSSNIKSL